MNSVFDNVLEGFAVVNLRREILDLKMVLAVAGNTPVGDPNPINWEEVTQEIADKRQQLIDILEDAEAVDILLESN